MSAFVVDDDTINRVVGFLLAEGMRNACLLCPLEELGHGLKGRGGGVISEKAAARLGMAMHLLNVEAVRQRYADADKADMIPDAYEYTPAPCSRVQAYKSLRCWRYQCSEGNVPKSALYKAMERVGVMLAESIVDNLPEYDLAAWA